MVDDRDTEGHQSQSRELAFEGPARSLDAVVADAEQLRKVLVFDFGKGIN